MGVDVALFEGDDDGFGVADRFEQTHGVVAALFQAPFVGHEAAVALVAGHVDRPAPAEVFGLDVGDAEGLLGERGDDGGRDPGGAGADLDVFGFALFGLNLAQCVGVGLVDRVGVGGLDGGGQFGADVARQCGGGRDELLGVGQAGVDQAVE